MRYPKPLLHAIWLKRYKRFLVDVRFPDGTEDTAHCPNTGTMKGINAPGSPCLLLPSDNPKRKLRYTLEAVEADGIWVGAHPIRANTIAGEAVRAGLVPELRDIVAAKPEVKYGKNSRADWVFEVSDGSNWTVEVKSASMREARCSKFPDAKTARGLKHLEELMEVVRQGGRAMMLFVATRDDVDCFTPAADIDPTYASRLVDAQRAGVVVHAITSQVTETEMTHQRLIPVRLPSP